MSIASEITRLQGAKADLATAIEGKGVTVPSATKLDGYADLVDAISQGGGGGTMQSKSVSYTPTTSAQSDTVTPDTGYDGLSSVAVSVAAMPTGTVGTPVAVVGTVTNNSVDVKPVVVTQAGYIATERKEGTSVTVSASDLVSGTKSITSNGNNQDVVGYASVDVNVPNTYSAGDEGKVVSSGALVSQSSTTKNANGTYDTTLNNEVVVSVANSYSAGDEGKVVSNGVLVAQTSDTVTANDTYDTTLINSLTVNVSGGGDITPLIMGVINGTVTSETVTQIGQAFAFSTGQFDVNLPNATAWTRSGGAYAFESSTGVRNIRIAKMPTIGSYAFNRCANLESVYAPIAAVKDYSFTNCAKLKTVVVKQFDNYRDFDNCTVLQKVDIITKNSKIDNLWQIGCPAFDVLIIRGEGVLTLTNITAFASTPFASGGTGGTLYVPNAVISSYQSASNWSTILGYANNQIKSIESTHTDPNAPIDLTTHYADGTLIPT